MKLRERRTQIFLSTGLVGAIGLILLISAWLDARTLNVRFPRMEYLGPRNPPAVRFEKKIPGNWVRLSRISTVAKAAVVVSEDWAFFEHPGFDWIQIREAVKANLKRHRYARGASTITQQVAKNLFMSSRKSLWRKFKELLWAFVMEKVVGKKKILETYFNIAEWGEGIYGIGAASRHYFSKDPSELTAKEGAFLAMLLPNPKKYSASYDRRRLTPYAEKTIDRILFKLVQTGVLDLETARQQAYDPLSFEKAEENEEVGEDSEE